MTFSKKKFARASKRDGLPRFPRALPNNFIGGSSAAIPIDASIGHPCSTMTKGGVGPLILSRLSIRYRDISVGQFSCLK